MLDDEINRIFVKQLRNSLSNDEIKILNKERCICDNQILKNKIKTIEEQSINLDFITTSNICVENLNATHPTTPTAIQINSILNRGINLSIVDFGKVHLYKAALLSCKPKFCKLNLNSLNFS